MEKLKNYINENKTELLIFILLSIFFYLQLVSAGIATHDELQNIYNVRTGKFFASLTVGRWGMTLMNLLPSYLQAVCTSQWTYRIFTMAGLLASCVSFCVFLKKYAGEKISGLMFMFFFLFAQWNFDHDGLFAFSFSYQLNTCYVFIALCFYYEFLKNRQKKYLISSAVLYLLSSMAYEAFVLYGILFFLMDFMYWIDRKCVTIRVLFKDLILHASLVTIYVLSYFLISAGSGADNGDAVFGTGMKLNEILGTMWKLAIGLFPLNYGKYSFAEFLRKSMELSSYNIVRWVFILIIAGFIYRLVTSARQLPLKKYVRISIFCFTGMILPGVLVACTNKFIDWIYYGTAKSFGVSYYSYFFITGWLAATFIFVYQKLPVKKIVLFAELVIIAFVAEFTSISNDFYIDSFAKQQVKYDLFCGIAETDYVKKLKPNAQLYAPDYTGIHYNMETISSYINNVAGTSVTATNNETSINYDNVVYRLTYDADHEALYLATMDQDGYTDEVFVYALHCLSGWGVLAEREHSSEAGQMYVNGEPYNIYAKDIRTGDISAPDNYMTVQCEDMLTETFEIYQSSVSYDNGIISTTGIYEQENWGRWAKQEFSVVIDHQEDASFVVLDLTVATPTKDGAAITVCCNEKTEEITTSGQTQIRLEVPIETGKNEITFFSSAPDMEVDADARKMNVQIYDMNIQYGGATINIRNLQ